MISSRQNCTGAARYSLWQLCCNILLSSNPFWLQLSINLFIASVNWCLSLQRVCDFFNSRRLTWQKGHRSCHNQCVTGCRDSAIRLHAITRCQHSVRPLRVSGPSACQVALWHNWPHFTNSVYKNKFPQIITHIISMTWPELKRNCFEGMVTQGIFNVNISQWRLLQNWTGWASKLMSGEAF